VSPALIAAQTRPRPLDAAHARDYLRVRRLALSR